MSSPSPSNAPFPTGSRWHINARKYDQSLRFSLASTLVSDDGDQIVLRADTDTLVHFYMLTPIRIKPMSGNTDFYFWRTLPYNIFVNRNQDESIHHFYCNVALHPTTAPIDRDDQFNCDYAISYVDMDIDVHIIPNGHYTVLDLDEFRDHSQKYGYTPDEQRAAYVTMLDIIIRWRTRLTPFDLI